MVTIRPNATWGAWGTSWTLLLCSLHCSYALAAEPRPAGIASLGVNAQHGYARVTDLKFTHLTTNDGLSQGYVVDILQDRRGFMWFATRDGLNRYDGYSFVVYKHDPNDPGSLSSNFLQDLMEDDEGYLWVATSTGVNRFDPRTERCTRYLHDPDNRDTLGGASVKSVVQDGHGYLWFGTEDSGLDKLDPRRGTFTHYRDDSDGRFVGRITQVIEDGQGEIWFTGERGLFHVDQQNGRVTRHPPASNALSADSVYEDAAGDLWLLANSPVAGLVRYDRRTERLTSYPLAQRASGALASTTSGGSLNGILAADGEDGLWVPSSEGLFYFDRRARRFTHRFRHDEVNPHSLDSNAIFSVYQDRGGVLWVGTENSGLNILNFRQRQFVHHMHRPADPRSLSPGRVKAIHPGPRWRGVVRLVPSRPGPIGSEDGPDHPLPSRRGRREDARCRHQRQQHLQRSRGRPLGRRRWQRSRPVRRTQRTLQTLSARPRAIRKPDLRTTSTRSTETAAARCGWAWRAASAVSIPRRTASSNYPVPDNPASLASTVWVIHQDRSGALWAGTWGGVLIRFDEQAKSFVRYAPDSRDPGKLNGGGINTILEDRSWNTVGGSVRRTVPTRPPKRSVRPLHGKPGPAQQQRSGAFWKIDSVKALAQHPEGRIAVRSSEGNIQKLRRVRRPAEQRVQYRVFSSPEWGDLLRRQQWVQRIRARERPGRQLRAAGRDHELHDLQQAGAHRA